MTSSTSAPAVRIPGRLSAPVLVGGAFALSTLANIGFQLADIVFTDKDPHRAEGPIESIVSIAVVGGLALVITVGLGLALAANPGRAKVGAIGLGALSIVTLVVFWSGAPAVFGAGAGWLAGLTRGRTPLAGAARGFGLVGLCIAFLGIVAVLGGAVFGIFAD